MEKEDIIKRVVSMEFNTFLNYYKNAPEIEVPAEGGKKRERGEKRAKGERHVAESGYVRLFINLGKKDGLRPREFMGFINRCARGKRIDLGRIDLMNNFSFFEVPEGQEHTAIQALSGADYEGRKVNIEISDPSTSGKNAAAPQNDDFGGKGGRRSERKGRNEREERRERQDRRGTRGKSRNEDPFVNVRKKGRGAAAERNRRNDRENEGRAPKGLPEWAKFFEGQVIEQPFYSDFTKKKKKKR